jgi:hypothetical protein
VPQALVVEFTLKLAAAARAPAFFLSFAARRSYLSRSIAGIFSNSSFKTAIFEFTLRIANASLSVPNQRVCDIRTERFQTMAPRMVW